MRTFNENLGAYHALNALGNIHAGEISRRLREASTREELEVIMKESDAYWEEQGKLYEKLGEEMVVIMGKKWWQFWK